MIISFDFLFRVLTLLIYFGWWLYWMIAENEAEQEKPKTIQNTGVTQRKMRRWLLQIVQGIVVLQVFGLQLFLLPGKPFLSQTIGFLLVIVGTCVSVSARKTLGTNWSHAFEYQVKKKQELVTTGIYGLIRHPIYTGLCLALVGGELVAQSYLVVVIGVILLFAGYRQAKLEERLLLQHFGNEYKTYMKHTKMFIPYLW